MLGGAAVPRCPPMKYVYAKKYSNTKSFNRKIPIFIPNSGIKNSKGRLCFKKKKRKFSELGIICVSTYLPTLNCDDVNSDNWPEMS